MSQIPTDPNTSTMPPSTGDFHLPVEPPAWPKVVGIISIVWASLGVLCNVCSLAGSAMQGVFLNMVPPEQQEQMKAQMAAGRTPLTLVLAALGILVSILLIAAGIQTVRRMPAGRMLHLAWAGLSLVLAVLGGAMGWLNMKTQLASTLQNDPNAAKAAGAATGVAYAMFGCIMILVIIWPVFCLIWFGVMGKRPEAGKMPEEPLV